MWPTTVEGWIVLVGAAIALLTPPSALFFRLGRLQQAIADNFAKQGERIGNNESRHAGHDAAIRIQEKLLQQLEFKTADHARQYAELNGRIAHIDASIHQVLRQKGDQDVLLNDRLARIEEQLKFIINAKGDPR